MNSYFTERLLLKPSNEAFAESVLEFYSRNKQFFKEWEAKREDSFYQIETQKQALKNEALVIQEGKMFKLWLFPKENETKIIGSLTFNQIARGIAQFCILGYNLDLEFNGQGYMSEALRKALDIAFSELKLHRIEVPIMPKNQASITLIERLGFEKEGIAKQMFCVNGVWEDHVVYSLINKNQ